MGIDRFSCWNSRTINPHLLIYLSFLFAVCLLRTPFTLRLLLLFFAQKLPDRLHFDFFIQQISNIPLAVVHHQRIVLISVSRLHTVNRRTLHCGTQSKYPTVDSVEEVKSFMESVKGEDYYA